MELIPCTFSDCNAILKNKEELKNHLTGIHNIVSDPVDLEYIIKMGHTIESFNDFLKLIVSKICNESDLQVIKSPSDECVLDYAVHYLVRRGDIKISRVIPTMSEGLNVLYTCNK